MENQKTAEQIMKEFLQKENIATRKGYVWNWESFQYTPQGEFVSVKGNVTIPAGNGQEERTEEVFWNFQGISMNGNAACDLVEIKTKEQILAES